MTPETDVLLSGPGDRVPSGQLTDYRTAMEQLIKSSDDDVLGTADALNASSTSEDDARSLAEIDRIIGSIMEKERLSVGRRGEHGRSSNQSEPGPGVNNISEIGVGAGAADKSLSPEAPGTVDDETGGELYTSIHGTTIPVEEMQSYDDYFDEIPSQALEVANHRAQTPIIDVIPALTPERASPVAVPVIEQTGSGSSQGSDGLGIDVPMYRPSDVRSIMISPPPNKDKDVSPVIPSGTKSDVEDVVPQNAAYGERETESVAKPSLGVGVPSNYVQLHITLERRSLNPSSTAALNDPTVQVGIGIGCEFDANRGDVFIHHVFRGGSADESGKIRAGDVVVQVDGKLVKGMAAHEVQHLLLGTPGTTVSLLLQRHVVAAPDVNAVRVDPRSLESGSNMPPADEERPHSWASQTADEEERRSVRERVLAAREKRQPSFKSDHITREPSLENKDTESVRPQSQREFSASQAEQYLKGVMQSSSDILGKQLSTRSPGKENEPAVKASPKLNSVTQSAAFQGRDQVPSSESSVFKVYPDVKGSPQISANPGDSSTVPQETLNEEDDFQSLEELKHNFQSRMNEAIRQQRERMRVLLSDVDHKISSLKDVHDGTEPPPQPAQAEPQPAQAEVEPRKATEDSRESATTVDEPQAYSDYAFVNAPKKPLPVPDPSESEEAPSLPPVSVESARSPTEEERKLMKAREAHTSKLMSEMSQLRQELKAAVQKPSPPKAEFSASQEVEEPDLDIQAQGLPDTLPVGAVMPADAQRENAIEKWYSAMVESDAEVADDAQRVGKEPGQSASQRKYNDIVQRLSAENAKSESDADSTEVDDEIRSVEDGDDSEAFYDSPINKQKWNPSAVPPRSSMRKTPKKFAPLNPDQYDVTPPRPQKRSILGAGIAAAVEVLNPGSKTPYSPTHVMTPSGPMVMGPEGPVPPPMHPFVQEQMQVLTILRNHPEFASKPPEVLKALTLRVELGEEAPYPETSEYAGLPDSRSPAKKSINWDSNVASEDGDSAQRLHEKSMAKRKQAAKDRDAQAKQPQPQQQQELAAPKSPVNTAQQTPGAMVSTQQQGPSTQQAPPLQSNPSPGQTQIPHAQMQQGHHPSLNPPMNPTQMNPHQPSQLGQQPPGAPVQGAGRAPPPVPVPINQNNLQSVSHQQLLRMQQQMPQQMGHQGSPAKLPGPGMRGPVMHPGMSQANPAMQSLNRRAPGGVMQPVPHMPNQAANYGAPVGMYGSPARMHPGMQGPQMLPEVVDMDDSISG